MKTTKKCIFCGKPFTTRSGMQRYCSETCQTEAKRARTAQKNNLFKIASPIMEIQHQEYLTFSKAAILMGCSRQYIYKLVATGKLKASRISNRMSFIRKADIERMLEGNPYHRILPGSTSRPKQSTSSFLLAKKENREHQLEKANQKMHEAEIITNTLSEMAIQKERQNEELDRAISEKRSKLNREKGSELLNAAVGWATGRSKALKGEIEDLRHEISTHEETIGQLQGTIRSMQNNHHRELMKLETEHRSELNRRDAVYSEETMKLKNRIAWQNLIIESLGFLLLKTSEIFRKAVHGIIRLARDYYKPRFDTEQVADIKGALNLFGEDRQSHRAAGDFLYFTAKQKGGFDNREQIKAKREVDNVVEGNYDQQQKRGFSIRR